MKKRILLFTLIAGFGALTLGSWITGVGATAGFDCTGAETGLENPTGCYYNSSCHHNGATPGITLSIELDSAGVPTTHYKGGLSYTIKITGTNTTTNILPKFGFQVGVITGSTAVTTPANAGTFGTVSGNIRNSPAISGYYVVNIVEQLTRLSPASGTGGTGTTYVQSIPWTAPTSGTGTISIWSALNAVNDDSLASTLDHWNTNHAVIDEWPAITSVANLFNNISVKAFPNPVSNNLQLQMDGATEGIYKIQVFDCSGRNIMNQNIDVSGNNAHAIVNMANWAPGLYNIVLIKDGSNKVIPVMKL